jgi:hypothetical protein
MSNIVNEECIFIGYINKDNVILAIPKSLAIGGSCSGQWQNYFRPANFSSGHASYFEILKPSLIHLQYRPWLCSLVNASKYFVSSNFSS